MSKAYNIVKFIAILGNFLFILWVTYNGIDEGFSGTLAMKVSYIGLMVLLILNIILLFRLRNI